MGTSTVARSRRSWVVLCTASVAVVALGLGVSSVSAESSAQTDRLSVSSAGEQGNDYSWGPSVSADGRFVAFGSEASNLVDTDTNEYSDVFVYDRSTQITERVSISSAGAQANSYSSAPSISADGRFVAFESDASNLVDADTNEKLDLFVHDRTLGTTHRVSISSTGAQANRLSYGTSISADGQFVAFYSKASNLVRADTNGAGDVFVHNQTTHVTRRVSVSSTGAQANELSYPPSVSGDGRFIAFASDARNLVRDDTNGSTDVFVHNRTTHVTRRVSVSSTGAQANNYSYYSSISRDGRTIAFASDARNLVRDDTNGSTDVFVHNRTTHVTRRVSVSSTGAQANDYSGDDPPSISAHGQIIAFASNATNLVRDDTNGADVFVHDRTTHLTRRVSVSSTRAQANGSNSAPSISADGRFVAFASYASNLVDADTNDTKDVFVRGPLY